MTSEKNEVLELMRIQTYEIKRQNDLHEKNLIAIEEKTRKCEELKIIKNKEIEQNEIILKLKQQDIEISIEQTKSINGLIDSSNDMIRGIRDVLKFVKRHPTQKGIELILTFLQTSNAPILLHVLNSLNSSVDKNVLISKLHETLQEIGKARTQINASSSFDVSGDFTSEDFNYIGGDKNINDT